MGKNISESIWSRSIYYIGLDPFVTHLGWLILLFQKQRHRKGLHLASMSIVSSKRGGSNKGNVSRVLQRTRPDIQFESESVLHWGFSRSLFYILRNIPTVYIACFVKGAWLRVRIFARLIELRESPKVSPDGPLHLRIRVKTYVR